MTTSTQAARPGLVLAPFPATTPPALAAFSPLRERALAARRMVIDMAATPTGCHLGGSLSVMDILIAALDRTATDADSEVVLSKGHAAAGLYAAMYVTGILGEDPVPHYGAATHHFTGHPGPSVEGVRFPTGSLGHGAPYALGWALSRRLAGTPGLGIAVLGDGELQEGLVWETCQVAAAQRVGNLIVVVDRNGGQNDGLVADISPEPRLAERFDAFGFEVRQVDGHDVDALRDLFEPDRSDRDRPLAIIADTVKGKGLRPVEGKAASHYVSIDARRAAAWKEIVR
ncbi:1-deoxy-D-xylulose-5-phosphate synthase N-terminal domain-containing protein [Streptomyces sp. CoH27]|uniref:1-deoxy-D-xylulose-5-phosphate synthase N-terminal domain-containing protein n=1 Tax=Streptomyces sp. CoH27 TaxID=2875763 RepID=UPI001CD4672C|nr:1-deoxy-D-xylulose-5-phosphate synthase N-terminal domain-containing protein [Streptomyces sp. CoH27]